MKFISHSIFPNDEKSGYLQVEYLLKYPLFDIEETLDYIFQDCLPEIKIKKSVVFHNGSALDEQLYQLIKNRLGDHEVITLDCDVRLPETVTKYLIEKYGVFTSQSSLKEKVSDTHLSVIGKAESLLPSIPIFLSCDTLNDYFHCKYLTYYKFCEINGGIPSLLSLISNSTEYFKTLFTKKFDDINLGTSEVRNDRLNNERSFVFKRNGCREVNFEECIPLLKRLWQTRPIDTLDGLKSITIPLSKIDQRFFIYYDKGNPIGTTHCYLSGDGWVRMRGTWVHEKARRQGVANALFEEVKNYAVLNRCETIYTYPRIGSEKFYTALGFIITGAPFAENSNFKYAVCSCV